MGYWGSVLDIEMTSNDDIMGFLLEMKEKRARENEELAEIRKTERAEDRKEMAKLIDNCLREKVAEAIAPFKQRTEIVEKAQLELKEQVNLLTEQLKSVKEKLDNGPRYSKTLAEVVTGDNRQLYPPGTRQQEGQDGATGGSHEEEFKSIISLSRKTVGLQKIDKDDLARMRLDQYGGAKTEEEEKLFAVQEFLQFELKLSRKSIEEMEIARIFPPSGKENPQWLYVTFKQEASVQKIFEKTYIMRKESRILTYIPREFHSRFEAMRNLANVMRFEQRCKTRIKMGNMDLQLHRKDRDNGRWERVQLPAGLPRVQLGISPGLAWPGQPSLGSPAPDRPGQNSSESRESTTSSDNIPQN